MKLKRREIILASVTGGLLLLVVVWVLFVAGDSRPEARLLEERKTLTAEVEKKQKLLDAARRDAKRIAEWRHRSLPANATPSVAPTLYQDWLLTLAERANIGQRRIEYKEVGSRHEVFRLFSFTLHGHAKLADVTRFMHQFYTAGHLHQIRRLDLKPIEKDSHDLDVTFTIEALALPDADRKDQLTKEPGRGLRSSKLEDYLDPITKRDVFAAYVRTEVKTVDPAEYTFVTGITEVNGTRQVWLFDRMAGKKWILSEGDSFQVGDAHGTVKTIAASREVTVDFDGRSRRLREGNNLRGGEAAEPEKAASPDKRENKDKTAAEPAQAVEKTTSQVSKADRGAATTAKAEASK